MDQPARVRLLAMGPWRAGLLGVLAGGLIAVLPESWKPAAIAIFFLPILVGLVWTDLKARRLPDRLTFPLIGSGIGFHLVGALLGGPHTGLALVDSISGAGIGYGLIWGLRWVWFKRHRAEAIGLGDAKCLSGIGAWVGAMALPYVLLIASALGLAAAFWGDRQTPIGKRAIPFGPALCAGFAIVWLGLQAFF